MKRRKLFLWGHAILCILLCAALSVGTIHMYTEGLQLRAAGNPSVPFFTREKAAENLRVILPLFVLELAFLLTSPFWNRGREERPGMDAEAERNRVCRNVARASETMRAERSRQKKLAVLGRVGAVVCLVPAVLYLVTPSHFASTELEAMMGSMLLHLIPWAAGALLLLSVTEVLRGKSMERETEAAKAQIRAERTSGSGPKPEETDTVPKPRGKAWMQTAMVLLALALILHGVLNGSMRDVLVKAITICTECIGLG